jgi:diguanylate cyclase (GGDEF)-like protein/PAS domain S-box-containing protein
MPVDPPKPTPPAIPFPPMKSLRFRFLFWVIVVLLCTLGGATYYVYHAQQDLLEKNLRSKIDAIGRFIALISPPAIYAYDITTLDSYVQQISNDRDVRFVQLRNVDNQPLTTYLPESVTSTQVETWIKQRDSAKKRPNWIKHRIITFDFPIRDSGETLGRVMVGLDTTRMIEDTNVVLLDLFKIFGAIVLSLGSLIFIIFKLHVLNPVGLLTRGAARIAEGDYKHQVAVQSNDELGHLTQCFNNMLSEISLDREALLATNKQLAAEIEHRRMATEELKKLSLAVEQSPASVLITDLQGRIEYANPKFTEVSGYSREEVIGEHMGILGNDNMGSDYDESMWKRLMKGEVWKGEFSNKRKNGSTYWESAVIVPIRGENGETTHFLAIKEDISERKVFEQKLMEQATHDQLTGLPNRFLAFDRLQQQLQYAERHHQQIAVIYIDLDNFKTVNDSMGHVVGDQLLIQVAHRIKLQLRGEDTLARLGGDEFLALVANLGHSTQDLRQVVNRLQTAMKSRYMLNNREIGVTSSLGIALYPDDGKDVVTLMSNADMAMYDAKHAGRNTFRFFTQALNAKVSDRMKLETRLANAFAAGELYPVYHPIIRLEDDALVGAEVLLRWESAEIGQVAPTDFIPVAEQTGLIRPITDWLFSQVLEHARHWRYRPEAFWLAVNVPPGYFCEESFNQTLTRIARQTEDIGLGLCVEITENMLLQNDEEAMESFRRLAPLGIATAMDDFGTGYSSLAYVKRFPLDHLKIDRSFIAGLPDEHDDRTLAETIVLMGHKMGISIIAEGVENQAQLDCLKSLNVEFAQGYLFAQPMRSAEFERYLSATRRKPATL